MIPERLIYCIKAGYKKTRESFEVLKNMLLFIYMCVNTCISILIYVLEYWADGVAKTRAGPTWLLWNILTLII